MKVITKNHLHITAIFQDSKLNNQFIKRLITFLYYNNHLAIKL